VELVRNPILEEVPLVGPISVAVREFQLSAFEYPWHRHPEVELTWILEGSGLRYVGDSVEPFRAGDFCLLGAHLPHAWLSSRSPVRGKARSLVIQFDPARLMSALQLLPEFAGIGYLLDRAAQGLSFDRRLGLRMRRKFLRRRSALHRFTALMEILDELALAPSAQTLSLAPWATEARLGSDSRIQRVLAHLTDQIGETISQARCARLVGLSPAAFSRFFRRAMGRTFQSYLCDLRLSVVCRQLLETDQSVCEIAYGSGFANLSNFNRAFRMRRGMSPSEFRRQSLRHTRSA
jgi:AraC-like DNA-binding protein